MSLRGIASRYGLSHKLVGDLLQAAAVPYPTREEAVQRLWNDPQFREKNGAAQAKVRGKYWQDPQKRQIAAAKLRESALRQWGDPEFRELVVATSSVTSKQRWQDPEYREKMAQYGVILGALNSDPVFTRKLAEMRKQQWEDPEFYARNADISRATLEKIKRSLSYRKKQAESMRRRWQDPEYRKKITESAGRNLSDLWKDPEFRAAATERSRQAMIERNLDPEFRVKGNNRRRELMQDPVYRDQYSETRRQISLSLWEDPEYRAKSSKSHKELWQDPEYRERISEAIRQSRLDPAFREKLVLPTIHGYRSDIDFYAQSAWEANVARVLTLVGRDYMIGSRLILKVTDDFRSVFQDSETMFTIDFTTTDKRGRTVMYELMAHPLEDPDGWAKLQMARVQYPDLVIRAVDERFYGRLRRRYESAVNASPNLKGWEKSGFNLKTHPGVFG